MLIKLIEHLSKHFHNFRRKVAQSMAKEPRRISSCGFDTGLTVILTPNSDDYHSSFFSSYGIRVIFIRITFYYVWFFIEFW